MPNSATHQFHKVARELKPMRGIFFQTHEPREKSSLEVPILVDAISAEIAFDSIFFGREKRCQYCDRDIA